MSAVSLFNNNQNVDLSYLKNLGVDATTQALAGSVQGRSISIRGGVFRMIVAGQEVAKHPDRHLNVIVVAAAPHISRAYYEGTYQEGVNVPPTCWSEDGQKPASNCPSKMNATCAGCLKDVKGSGQNGSKACRYNQRIAVVLASDPEGEVFRLQLAATSLFGKGDDAHMPLQQYTRKLTGHGLPISAVVTRMEFDLDSTSPKLVFSAERPLTEREYQIVVRQGQSEEAQSAINTAINISNRQPEQAALAAPEPTPAVVTPVQAAPEPVTEEPAVREKAKAAPAPAAKNDVQQMLEDWGVDD